MFKNKKNKTGISQASGATHRFVIEDAFYIVQSLSRLTWMYIKVFYMCRYSYASLCEYLR